MFKADTDTLELTGKSGNKYIFKMCEYDTMESIDKACENFTAAGLYVFAYRYTKPIDTRQWYALKYVGETDNYSQRDYSNHHKKKEIVAEKCNAWGYCTLSVSDDKRKEIEADIIANYNLPCNGNK